MPLEIKLTDFCNLSCTYCYYKNQRSCFVMPFETVINAVSRYLDYVKNNETSGGTQKHVSITFFGGEPLLCADTMCRTVDYFSAKDNPDAGGADGITIHWLVCTNGTLLDQHMLTELQKRNITIVLSLDGPSSVHNAHRVTPTGEGSFEMLALPAPELARSIKTVETVISPDTASNLYESVTWLWNTGFTHISAVPDFTAEWTPEIMDTLFNQYQFIADEYYQRVKKGGKVYFSILNDKISLARTGLSYRQVCCTFGGETFVADTRGNIYPCTRFACDLPNNDYCIGTITSDSSSPFVDDEKRRRLTAQHRKPRTECADCTYTSLCLANQCACISFSLFGAIDRVSPAVCTHERNIIGIADTLAEKLFDSGLL